MWNKHVSRNSDSYRQARYTGHERRISSRIQTPFPVIVRGVEVNEQPFEEHTILDNLSSCGLYLPLTRRVRQGIRLLVLIRCSVSHDADAAVAWIELHGMVSRTGPIMIFRVVAFVIDRGSSWNMTKEVSNYDALDRWVKLAASVPHYYSRCSADGVWHRATSQHAGGRLSRV